MFVSESNLEVTRSSITWEDIETEKSEVRSCYNSIVFLNSVVLYITELQNYQGWKRPLNIILSNLPAQAVSPKAHYTQQCPGGF